jgi:hypothetical protein
VTVSNIAYTILVYENCKEVWEEEWHIKKSIIDDIKRKQATCHKKPKYHEGRGSKSRDMVMDGQMLGGSITKNC